MRGGSDGTNSDSEDNNGNNNLIKNFQKRFPRRD